MERRPIQPLPLSLVNRIAAGEVIERPASVVKELVENAIDAGATEIVVETEEGGRQLIRVVDNGSGIGPEDLPLAFAEHATSKLRTDEDLFRIGTMGFRGEALASIGSVSQARILSRTAGSEAAWEVHNRGGEISQVVAAAGNVGTTVEMRELFYNVPARRKFLKGAATESGHVSETLLRLALPHPHIAFRLLSGGRKSLDLPVVSPEQRLLAAWPEEFAGKRLTLDLREGDISIRGLVGLPELAHPTARHQYFYLNGRHIRDRFIQHALREAYRGLMEPGRQPAAILLIEMPPDEVDVNVHPAKAEVRFKDSGRLHGLLLAGIREKLLGSDLTPTARPGAGRGGGEGGEQGRPDMRARLAEFFKQSYAGKQQQMGEPVDPAAFIPGPIGVAGDSGTAAILPASGAGWKPALQAAPESVAMPDPIPRQPSAAPLPTLAAAEVQSPAIQLHNAYLVTETADGMLIIDQHALHERIMYEDLKARLGRGPLEAQRLLIPETINASAKQMALLEQIGGLLARLGIEVAAFGPAAVAVQAFPSFLGRLEPGRFVRELLERGEQDLLDVNEEEALHEILDMMACKAAIKAGDPLTPQEIEALLARKDLVERSSNCPHGRPTTLRLSLRDLEKQFKRTGF